MFKPNTLYYTDGYKIGHKAMLAPGTTKLYGTWIPRSTKHAPKGITKIVSFGQQLVVRWLHDEFQENFFKLTEEQVMLFGRDMEKYLGLPYDATHFLELHRLGYLPIRIKSLPEGIETSPNIPHMTFVNTVDGFAWLTLYLETIISSLAWKASTSATIALHYRRSVTKWVMKTDPKNAWLIPYLCHDFSARGLDPFSMLSSGLGHATSFRGTDTIMTIPGARYFYDESLEEVSGNSVNASEHSVSTTKIFTVGESQMIADWLDIFPNGILSIVSDTFDLWQLITKFLPEHKEKIMSRNGKLVIRPDSGNPVDIICGTYKTLVPNGYSWDEVGEGGYIKYNNVFYKAVKDGVWCKWEEVVEPSPASKGVIELLWDIFGGTTNHEGYKVLDPHIGAIYGDSITTDRQVEIYERLAAKGFAATNIVLGVGSFTYQYNTRDTLGFAAKGAWFEVAKDRVHNDNGRETEWIEKIGYNIYKDPVTDDGTKKSLKGLLQVQDVSSAGELAYSNIKVFTECTPEQESTGLLQVIYENGKFYNQTTLSLVRKRIDMLVESPTNMVAI